MKACATRLNGLLLIITLMTTPAWSAGTTTRVNVMDDGTEADIGTRPYSDAISVSTDGRYVVFDSTAALVPDDFNNQPDVYLYDRLKRRIERVSVASDGSEAMGFMPSISADGRYVAFVSISNVLDPDLIGQGVFVRDLKTGITSWISQGTSLNTRTYISADGRYVTWLSDFSSYCSAANFVHVHDRKTHKTVCGNLAGDGTGADGWSDNQSISADGRYLLFRSCSTNLTADDLSGYAGFFLRDLKSGKTRLVSGSAEVCSGYSAYVKSAQLSADGRYAAISTKHAMGLDPTGGTFQVNVMNLVSGAVERVSVDNAGVQGDRGSYTPSISADGRYVVFASDARNFDSGDTNGLSDLYVHDRVSHRTRRVPGYKGAEPNGTPYSVPWLSGDGRYVAFNSNAENMVPNDLNVSPDSFLVDRLLARKTVSDIAVSFASGPTTAMVGDLLTYQIDIAATGAAGKFAQLQVLLPSNLALVSASMAQGKCGKGNLVVCRPGNIPDGTSVRLTLEARAKSRGTVRLAAFANAVPKDKSPANNVDYLKLKVQ